MKKIISIFSLVLIFLVTQGLSATDDELFNQGVALLKQDKAKEAVQVFTQVIENVPDSPDAFRNRGVGYMKLSRYDEAILDFEKAMSLKPDLKDLYSNMGVAWYYKKEYHKAIEFYDRELALRPDNHYGYFNRAICQAALNEFELALKDVEMSLGLFPTHYLALCLKGDLLVKTGKPMQAKRAYQKAVSLDSDHTYAKKQLGSLKKEIHVGGGSLSGIDGASGAVSGQAPLKTGKQKRAKRSSPSFLEVFELQAGAYLGKENAQKMMEKISKKGYSARILELTGVKGRQWFLVRTGRFSTRAEAVETMAKMKSEFGGSFIIRPSGGF